MPTVFTINGGSSSIRFALYDVRDCATKLLDGKIDRIGVDGTHMRVAAQRDGATSVTQAAVDAKNHRSVVQFLMNWLGAQAFFAGLGAVGHRVVHGMQHSRPERVTPELLRELHGIVAYDSEHLPRELELIEGFVGPLGSRCICGLYGS